MSAKLLVGCIIDSDTLIDYLNKNRSIIELLEVNEVNEGNEVNYDNLFDTACDTINDILEEYEMPFKFYTPIYNCGADSDYYLSYNLKNTNTKYKCVNSWDYPGDYESIDYDLLIKDYKKIKKSFDETTKFLFGENSNKCKLQIISNYTDT